MAASKEEILEALGHIFAELTQINDISKNISKLSVAQAKVERVEAIGQELTALKPVIFKYNAKCQTPKERIDLQKYAFTDLMDNIKTIYFELTEKEKLKSKEGGQFRNVEDGDTRGGGDHAARVKLPKLNLPSFSGELGDWPEFIDSFNNSIHENASLSDVQKFQYLKASLKGEALKLVAKLHLTSKNYPVAYELLTKRYQNKRLLASHYLKQLFDFRPIPSDSVSNLRNFLVVFQGNVMALEALKLDDLPNFLLFYMALNCLDISTRQLFEAAHANREIPRFESLIEFVQGRLKINSLCVESNTRTRATKPPQVMVNRSEQRITCSVCRGPPHDLDRCEKFKELTPWNRFTVVRRNNFCFRCLSPQHFSFDCESGSVCSICSKEHHSLLHIGDRAGAVEKDVRAHSPQSPAAPTVLHFRPRIVEQPLVLLSTAKVAIRNCGVSDYTVRVLIDSGSQANLITSKCLKRFGVGFHKRSSAVKGMAAVPLPVRGSCRLAISPLFNKNLILSVEFLVVDNITDDIPFCAVNLEGDDFLEGLPLADESFGTPGGIDGILGAGVYAQIVGSRSVKATNSELCAVETSLGYLVMGSLGNKSVYEEPLSLCLFNDLSLDNLVKSFLEIEDVGGPSSIRCPDDDVCEDIFKSSVTRDSQGRYSVDLPFREDPSTLGDSLRCAKSRLFSLEKKLRLSEDLRQNYNKVMQTYLDLGYMSHINEPDLSVGYYIPHHGVVKRTSSSTPLRIVFDGSAKTSSSKSLNDILYPGPKLQSDLFSILLNFRLFRVALTADVRQMYLRIGINPHHRKYQRLLWRFDSQDPVSAYELNTVTFGLSSSPYLALRVVQQLVEDEKHHFPNACKIIPTDMYVDDLTTSCDSVEEGKVLFTELVALFRSGNFDLVKWSTNSPELLKFIPADFHISENVTFDGSNYLKVLGLMWSPLTDVYTFSIEKLVLPQNHTKRTILSILARIYDPLGFLSCITVFVKLILKELWILKLTWDENPPLSIINSWEGFLSELPLLTQFTLPRHLMVDKDSLVDIVGFCDASLKAYGAVVYFRTTCGSSLAASKSKIAPLKPMLTIPRLELCSAVLLAKLLRKILDASGPRIKIGRIWAFSDSQVALGWINSSPSRWQTFVAHRVAQIQEMLPEAQWLYVPSRDNPADCISRSVRPSQFFQLPLWFHGPSWLGENPETWSIDTNPICQELDTLPEQKPKLVLGTYNPEHPLLSLSLRFSSWNRYVRSVVYVLRFCHKIKSFTSVISSREINLAEFAICEAVQFKHFGVELQLLASGELCSPKLRNLSPFLQDGLIRVGGRLSQSDLPFDSVHPILLPSQDHIVEILVDHYHRKNLHTGPSLLLSLLRQRFWILSARRLIKRRLKLCNFCFKFNPKPTFPSMGDLPKERVNTSKPFEYVGVDYMGPFHISLGRFRGSRTQKSWVCVFVCLATKALHLELVSELSTVGFLAALKRFLARRGQCRKLFSDQGTNFIGAHAHLKELYQFLSSAQHKAKFAQELADQRIDWHFNPPSAPHFGGLWEAQVKSVKRHLIKVIGDQKLTYEEMFTLLSQIEALLNSRPLSIMSDDPNEPAALTPSHFLVGSPLKTLPSCDVTDVSPSRLRRPQLLDSLVQHWWRRWSREYLHTLQVKQKWLTPSLPVTEGMLVLVQDPNLPPFQWPLGVITKVFPGRDNVTRVAEVRTSRGSYRRPVVKLCPLPRQ